MKNRRRLLPLFASFMLLLFSLPLASADHNHACRAGSFTITTGGTYNCNGEDVGGPGATITVSPGISVTLNNVGTLEASSVASTGASASAGCFSNGQSAANITVNANKVAVNSVSLRGGDGGDAASVSSPGSPCEGGKGGDAGRFAASAAGDINVDAVTVLPGNGGKGKVEAYDSLGRPCGSCATYGAAADAGDSGLAGYVKLSGSRIEGRGGGLLSITGTGGRGGDSGGAFRSTYSDWVISDQGRGSDAATVELLTQGAVRLGTLSLKAGSSGTSGLNYFNVYGHRGGSVAVGNSTVKSSSVSITRLDVRGSDYGRESTSSYSSNVMVTSSGDVNIGIIDAYAKTSSPHRADGAHGGSVLIDGKKISVGSINAYGGDGVGVLGSSAGYPAMAGNGGYVSLKADTISIGSTVLNGGSSTVKGGGGSGGRFTAQGTDLAASGISAKGGVGDGGYGAAGGTVELSSVINSKVSSIDVSGGNPDAYYSYQRGAPGKVYVRSNLCLGGSCGSSVIGGDVFPVYNSISIPAAVCVVAVPSS